jgi:glyoxylase-like metal-dependent hydrolase (beta-lactamase superfamily II)
MNRQNCVKMLEISTNIMGSPSTIHPTLILDSRATILVDAGYPGQLPQIRQALEGAGVSLDQINLIIVTHHDIDHIGNLAGIKKELSDRVKILAHEEEKAYIEGEKRPLKLAQLEANLEELPEERKAFYHRIKAGFENSQVEVDQTLVDGEKLPYCGGIRIIFTPGHTLGHICLYLQESKTLIAGDALRVEDGKLIKTPPFVNYDLALYQKSLQKLAQYDIERVICYHGGLYASEAGNATQRIAALANET